MDNKLILENEKYLYEIADFWFVRSALQSVVFNKLFFDGYVCCNEGLYPSNKETLKSSLREVLNKHKCTSEFTSLIEDNNPKDLKELYDKCCSLPEEKRILFKQEQQIIVYALLQTFKKEESEKTGQKATFESICIMRLLEFYFDKTRFHQCGNFIVADDIDLVEIKSLDQYVKETMAFPEKTNLLFRGHTNINYEIKPSLFRDPRLYKNEYMMYQELVLRCPDDFLKCETHLDFLVEMQHYGLPTRLLDFSFNPLVALYFACESKSNTGEVIVYTVQNDSILYAKDKTVSLLSCLPMMKYKKQCKIAEAMELSQEIQEAEFGEYWNELRMELPQIESTINGNFLRWPVFVKPTRSNKRIAHQEGAFLLWGINTVVYSDSENISSDFIGDQEKYRYTIGGRKRIFYVSSSNKEKIEKSLKRLGINKAYIYPEIDDVAEFIKDSMK